MTRVPALIALVGVLALAAAVPAAAQDLGPDGIPYRTGTWDSDTLGNHRVVLRVDAAGDAVRVHIPWRRRDTDPEKKKIVVTDPKGVPVDNLLRVVVNREYGDLVFQPIGGPGEYDVYDMPYEGSGRSNYPRVTYPEPVDTAAETWMRRNGLSRPPLAPAAWARLPEAKVVAFEAIDALDSFFPMEVIATKAETEALLARHAGAPYLLFPEDRTRSIRMTDDLPYRWVQSGADQPFRGEAMRGEFYAFQIGVYAVTQPIANLDVRFEDWRGPAGAAIPAAAATCFNLGGVDWTGTSFRKQVPVEAGKVQAIWCGVQVPEDAAPGAYAANVTVAPAGLPATAVPVTLDVSPEAIADHGDDDPWRMSRLRWLDSTIAVDDDLVAPYTPVTIDGRTLGVLGRTVTLDALGFPRSIRSRFAIEMTHLADTGREVLAGPVSLVVAGADGRVWPWRSPKTTVTKQATGVVGWDSTAVAGPIRLDTRATLEFDGMTTFEVHVRATKAVDLSDIRLEIPIARDVAKIHDGHGPQGRAAPAVVRLEVEHRPQPGFGLDRRRERGPAVQPAGRALPASAQHELLPPAAARHAAIVVERRTRRLPVPRARRGDVPGHAATAARARWPRATSCATTSSCCSRRSTRCRPTRSGAPGSCTPTGRSRPCSRPARP